MGWASRSGRARTNASNPQAFAVCDRCGIWYNHVDLKFQYDYRGATLQNIQLLVCKGCYDTPQENIRSIVLPADPVPIPNPRVESFLQDETNYRTTSGLDTTDARTGIPVPGTVQRATQTTGDLRVAQQTGESPGGLNTEPGTDPNAPGNSDPGLPLDNTTVPNTGPIT